MQLCNIQFLLAGLDIAIYKAKQAIQNNLNDRVCMQPAHDVAQSFSSSNPYFLRIMKSFNISGSYTLVGNFI